jgi:hypothetical protein
MVLFRPIRVLPLLVWAWIYSMFIGIIHVLTFWAIMFTGRHPQNFWDYIEGFFRFVAKLNAYLIFLTDRFPPFAGGDEQPYPVKIKVQYPGRLSRATVFFRVLILLPHFFFSIGYGFVFLWVHGLNFWTILFTGRLSDWQYSYALGFFVYMSRLNAYMLFLVDEYPPFNGAQPQAAAEQFV